MSRGPKRKILMLNENGEIVGVYNGGTDASRQTGVSRSTINYQCYYGGKSINGEFRFVFEKDYNKNTNEKKHSRNENGCKRDGVKVLLISKKDNSIIKSFNSIKEASEITGVPKGTIGTQVCKKGKSRNPDSCFIYEKDYRNGLRVAVTSNEEETKEVINKKETMYYINVLIGLVKGTLENRAKYIINGTEMIYNKEEEALMFNEHKMITRESLIEEIEVTLPILNDEERTFISNLLKAFTRVNGIRKCNDIRKGFEFIRVESTTPSENVDLPAFVEGKYYKNLKTDRLYTLEELGL